MMRHFKMVALVVFGLHSMLMVMLAIVDATRGISDQDVTFLLGLLVSFLDYPALQVLGPSPGLAGIILAGSFQWFIVAVIVATVPHGVTLIRRRPSEGESREESQPR